MPLLQLRREHVDAMIAHARETAPEECCGLIGGIEAVVKAFSISEREQRWQQVEYEIAD